MDSRTPNPSRQPYRKAFRLRHIVQVKQRPAHYTLYSRNGKPLYKGSSRNVKSRLIDLYYGRGDARTVASKARLREKMEGGKFDIHYDDNIYDNRERERKEKQGLPFNVR